MPRPLRWFQAGQVYEITSRTLHGRYALAPKPALVQECYGILAEACARWPSVRLFQIVMPSTHMHMLATSRSANTFARWMSFVKAAIARAAQFHHGLRGAIWGRRFRAIPILDDASLRARVKYLMAQMCSEGCDRVVAPRRWPGVKSVDALCRGAPLRGTYVSAAERRRWLRAGRALPLNRVLTLAPLPNLPVAEHARQTWFRKIEQEVIAEARARRRERGIVCRPPETLSRWNPQYAPREEARSPAPACHASSRARRRAFGAALRDFVAQWREALEAMKSGQRVEFPPGSWWPFDCHVCWQRE